MSVLMILQELSMLSRVSSVVSVDVSRRKEDDIRSISVGILSKLHLYLILYHISGFYDLTN
jgi:hypothetical protein